MRPIRLLIVDDEPLAVRRLQLLLEDVSDRDLAIDTADGVGSALERIVAQAPDIILLDVRMRDGSGFDVLECMPPDVSPSVIFVTAFDDTATRAFDACATDYLLKPVQPERLRQALDKACRELDVRQLEQRLEDMRALVSALRNADAESPSTTYETDFWIRRSGGDFVRIAADAIEFATVEDDYVRIHANGRSFLLRESIRGLLKRLDPAAFMQTHRSTLVRCSAVAEVSNGRLKPPEIVLFTGVRLKVGRVHAKALRERFRAPPRAPT